ncbi:hypothetical protein C8J56DRAFT_901249 [Mycena floridula]|nr:hypothetical protein C8J56DRAFT_901249 [Mycena floridula]
MRRRALASCLGQEEDPFDGSGWGTTSLLKTLDTEDYNVIVMSPKNFLFAPLLPSIAVGTLSPRSILQPTRYLTRYKNRGVAVIDAEATKVDAENRTVTFADKRLRIHHHDPVRLARVRRSAEVQTFGIKGVHENACFMKEIADAEKMQRRFMDCLESAGFMGQLKDEISTVTLLGHFDEMKCWDGMDNALAAILFNRTKARQYDYQKQGFPYKESENALTSSDIDYKSTKMNRYRIDNIPWLSSQEVYNLV